MTQASAPVAPSGGVPAGQTGTPAPNGAMPAVVPMSDFNALRSALDRRNAQTANELQATRAMLDEANRQIEALRRSQEAIEDAMATPEEKAANEMRRLKAEVETLKTRPPLVVPTEPPTREPSAADVRAAKQAFVSHALQQAGLNGSDTRLGGLLELAGSKGEVLSIIAAYKPDGAAQATPAPPPTPPAAPNTRPLPTSGIELVGYTPEQVQAMTGQRPLTQPPPMPPRVETAAPSGDGSLPPFDGATIKQLAAMGKKGMAEIARRRELHARATGVTA